MATKDDCIFCKIANHEIESEYVYEDDRVTAFKDAHPLAPVHVLVVPKDHYENITDGVPADLLEALVHGVGEVGRITGVDKTGFRVITNTGNDAGQTIHHLHMHVLGGRIMTDGGPEGAGTVE